MFSINTVTGALLFIATPNFEMPGDADADNVYQVDVTVSDGNGGTATAVMAVTVTDANDAPVSANVDYTMAVDSVLNVNAAGVLAGDLDEDGNPLTAVLVVGPAAGSLTLNADGSFAFTPPIGFDGTLWFSYVAHDGTTSGNLATVTITVNTLIAPPPVDAPPAEEPPVEETPEEEVEPPVSSTPPAPAPAPPPEPAPPATSAPAPNESVQPGVLLVEAEANLTGLDHQPFVYEGNATTLKALPSAIRDATSQVAKSIDEGLAFVLDTLVWQDLDELKNRVDNLNGETPVIAGTTAGVTTIVTAVYVMWTIRGGWLVSSLLAQMPAWQLVDPLLILDSMQEDDLLDDEDHEEDKKVEEMFDESAKAQQ